MHPLIAAEQGLHAESRALAEALQRLDRLIATYGPEGFDALREKLVVVLPGTLKRHVALGQAVERARGSDDVQQVVVADEVARASTDARKLREAIDRTIGDQARRSAERLELEHGRTIRDGVARALADGRELRDLGVVIVDAKSPQLPDPFARLAGTATVATREAIAGWMLPCADVAAEAVKIIDGTASFPLTTFTYGRVLVTSREIFSDLEA